MVTFRPLSIRRRISMPFRLPIIMATMLPAPAKEKQNPRSPQLYSSQLRGPSSRAKEQTVKLLAGTCSFNITNRVSAISLFLFSWTSTSDYLFMYCIIYSWTVFRNHSSPYGSSLHVRHSSSFQTQCWQFTLQLAFELREVEKQSYTHPGQLLPRCQAQSWQLTDASCNESASLPALLLLNPSALNLTVPLRHQTTKAIWTNPCFCMF